MNLRQLKKQITSEPPQKCYLLCGNDNYIIGQALKSIEESLNIQFEELNYSKFGENVNMETVVAALQMLPFSSQYRLAVVKEFYPNAANCQMLSKSFLSKENTTSVLVIANNKPCEQFKKLNNVTLVECDHPSIDDCAMWITKKMKNNEINIAIDDAIMIADYSQLDMAAILLQCEKLISYLEKGQTVTAELIESSVTKSSSYKIFEFTDALAMKNEDKAYTIMDNMLSDGNAETALLAAIYNHFRNMLYVTVTKLDSFSLAKMLSLPEFAIRRYIGQAKKFSPKSLKTIVEFLSETEYKLKSSQLGAGTFFKYLVLKLINI